MTNDTPRSERPRQSSQSPGEGVMPLIAERRSPAVFDPTYELSDDDVETLLDAARWAPSWGNTQPYRFLVGVKRDGCPDANFSSIECVLLEGNRRWAPAASAFFVLLQQLVTLPDDEKEFRDDDAVLFDLGQAAAFLTMQAHSMGLAAHQFAGFDGEALAEIVGLGREWRVAVGVAVGRAWPEDERDPSHASVIALRERVPEYDLEGNAARERKPRSRRSIDAMRWRPDM